MIRLRIFAIGLLYSLLAVSQEATADPKVHLDQYQPFEMFCSCFPHEEQNIARRYGVAVRNLEWRGLIKDREQQEAKLKKDMEEELAPVCGNKGRKVVCQLEYSGKYWYPDKDSNIHFREDAFGRIQESNEGTRLGEYPTGNFCGNNYVPRMRKDADGNPVTACVVSVSVSRSTRADVKRTIGKQVTQNNDVANGAITANEHFLGVNHRVVRVSDETDCDGLIELLDDIGKEKNQAKKDELQELVLKRILDKGEFDKLFRETNPKQNPPKYLLKLEYGEKQEADNVEKTGNRALFLKMWLKKEADQGRPQPNITSYALLEDHHSAPNNPIAIFRHQNIMAKKVPTWHCVELPKVEKPQAPAEPQKNVEPNLDDAGGDSADSAGVTGSDFQSLDIDIEAAASQIVAYGLDGDGTLDAVVEQFSTIVESSETVSAPLFVSDDLDTTSGRVIVDTTMTQASTALNPMNFEPAQPGANSTLDESFSGKMLVDQERPNAHVEEDTVDSSASEYPTFAPGSLEQELTSDSLSMER